MTRAKISQYSATAGDNTDVNGVNIAEGCPPSSMNNMGREIMAALKRFQVGSDGDGVTVGGNLVVSGSTTLSSTATLSNVTSATLAAGSASAPTLHAAGDTNTGVYFPSADQVAVAAGGAVAAAFNSHQFMGMRNRIINGDMRIAQRGTTANPTGTGYFTVDRFRVLSIGGLIAATAPVTSQSTTAPVGFINSFLWTNTNAVTPSTTDSAVINHYIEGTNVADLGFGTANAKTVTVSFWVRSSLTGTFGASLQNGGSNRSYPYTYSISAADTWEYKTVTIPGDTTGTWLTDTGVGLRLNFSMGTGPDRLGTAGAWNSNNNYGATGQVQLVATAGATFYITGVQLEVGSVATPFERRPYGTELALCQRYYWKYSIDTQYVHNTAYNFSATQAFAFYSFPVTMRTTPTLSTTGTAGDYRVQNNVGSITLSVVPFLNTATDLNCSVVWEVASGLTAGNSSLTRFDDEANDVFLAWSAEL